MMQMKGFVAVILLLAATQPAKADWYVNFIQITCIPEARYLAFEAKDIEGSYVLMEAQFDDKKRAQRMNLWMKQGYFDPSKLDFECRMPESTYKITATQPPASARGQCGAAPSITLSLLRDGKPYLSNVTFGDDCFGGASVYRVELSDGLQGWDTRQMTICTTPGTDHCKFLSDTYQDIVKAVPIDQSKVAGYAENKK